MISFNEYIERVNHIDAISRKVKTLEDFLETLDPSICVVEEVTTGDMAQVVLPLMLLKRKKVYEKAPPDKEIEDSFIKKNKSVFKKLYGKDWEQILYATAWKIYNSRGKKE